MKRYRSKKLQRLRLILIARPVRADVIKRTLDGVGRREAKEVGGGNEVRHPLQQKTEGGVIADGRILLRLPLICRPVATSARYLDSVDGREHGGVAEHRRDVVRRHDGCAARTKGCSRVFRRMAGALHV